MPTTIKNKPLLPKLRFPEFRGDGAWEERRLGYFLNEHKIKSDGKCEVHSVSVHKGVINQKEHLGRSFAAKDTSNYHLAHPNDVIYTKSPTGDFPFGIVKKSRLNQNVIVSPLYGVFTPISSGIGHIVDCFFESPQRAFKYLDPITQKGAKNTIQITNQGFLSGLVLFPDNLPEQQKIAECLGSLDELIAAHSSKRAALQDHKKGLLQQLFPKRSENLEPERSGDSRRQLSSEKDYVPALRFPEFQNAGAWVETSIQDLIDRKYIIGHLDGNHGALYPRAEEFSKEGVPYITANDFGDGRVSFDSCKFLPKERALLFKKGVAKNGDILFAHNATVGPVAKLSTSLDFVILSTTATYFRCDQTHLRNEFLMSALRSSAFVMQYSRVMSQSTRNQVPITAQRKFKLNVPSLPEQQKIADCLGSLDSLITAETEQIESLKTHKKGLMQQLFPNPED
ncbi:MAG: restriction endonuclease subunit S [Verrucomicrobiales bacterium]|nr:restriction endonuclease subunit S [Verrucomicrobiales bacterium]